MITVSKPWGYYIDIYRAPGGDVVLKQLCIKPGEEISYQRHHNRSEMWYIISGNGRFVKNGENRLVGKSDCVTIDRGAKHQIVNVGDDLLLIHEMQCGECSEDDIERISDKYGR